MTARMFTCPMCQKTRSFKAIQHNHFACLTSNCLLAERLIIHAEFSGNGDIAKNYGWVLEPGDVLHGKYEIIKLLGKGGYGATYQAKDRDFSTQVFAIKEIPRQYCDNEEDGFLMRLNHPAIPKFYEHFNIDDMHYSIMEFIEGENLENFTRNLPKVGLEKLVLKIIDQVCDVLSYVHSEGVIHRDLKPENILVRRNGTIALIDFGIAKRVTSTQGTRHLAQAASLFFAPPEQYQAGKGITDVRSDIYSLGAILYFLLTGREPIDSNNRRQNEDISPLPRTLNSYISKKVESVIIKAMAMAPKDRYETIAEFKNALLDVDMTTAKICPKCGRFYRGKKLTCQKCGGPTHPLGSAEHAPFVFRSGERASNLREFINACYQNWQDAAWHLYKGDFESWLLSIQEGALADRAANIRKFIDNQDKGLNQFLMSSPYGVAPKLELNHNKIDFLPLKHGTQKSISIKITNVGQGYLTGEIRLENPCCSLSNRFFSCFAGETQQITLTVDADKLPSFQNVKTNLIFESNVGNKKLPLTIASELSVIQWKVTPETLHFQQESNQSDVKGFSIELTSGHGKLSGTITPGADWIRVNPSQFTARNQLVSVEMLPDGLKSGYYKGEIVIKTQAGRKTLDVFYHLKTAQSRPIQPRLPEFISREQDDTRPVFQLGKLTKEQVSLALLFTLLFLVIRWHGPKIENPAPNTVLVLGFVIAGGLVGLTKKMIKIFNNWLAGLVVGFVAGLVSSAFWNELAMNVYNGIQNNIVEPLVTLFDTHVLAATSFTIFGLLGCYIGGLIGLFHGTHKWKLSLVNFLSYFVIMTSFVMICIFISIFLIPIYL